MANAQAISKGTKNEKGSNGGVLKIAQQAQNLSVLLFLVLLYVVVGILNPNYISGDNLANIIVETAILAVVAYGMTFAIAMGVFDLSVGSIQALCASVVATMLMTHGIITSIGIALVVGFLIGIVNGVLISKLRVPAFVATLGTMSVVRGAALLYTDGVSILIKNQSFGAFNTRSILGIPLPIMIAVVILIVLWAIFKHTPFGRHIAAVGGNPNAAVAAGLNVDRITIIVFGIVGLTAAFSGVMLSSQLMNVTGSMGMGLEMNAIAAVVLGGTSMQGGRGSLVGTLVGAFLLSSISTALDILNIPSFFQYLATGLLLIGALSLDSARRQLIKSLLRRSART
ncbi:ABC transporter permease [Neobacillus muris]|uniref:ABC transporter permease n=1 Tax=Neobacillus muris TaxID=2941334 RepID=UPI00203E4C4D|nr:ABC transporter permease [Neobacillus muris]